MTADQFFEALGWVVAVVVTGLLAETRVKLGDERHERRMAERRLLEQQR